MRYYKNVKDNKGTIRITKASKFKLLWDFKEPYKTRLSKELNNLTPLTSSILFDIDSDSLADGMESIEKISSYLYDKYNAIGDVYYSGKKGYHLVYNFKEPFNFTSISTDNKANIIKEYALMLDEIKSNIGITLDESLQEVTRLIQLPNIKKDNEDGRGFKILIGNTSKYCKDIDSIKQASAVNKNIGEPANCDNDGLYLHLSALSEKQYQNQSELPTSDKENHQKIDDDLLYAKVFNDMKVGRHKRIGLLGAGLNGYVDRDELESIYQELADNTDIEGSTNAKRSFYDAFDKDRKPYSLGALYNFYNDNKMDKTNLNNLSNYLTDRIVDKDYDKFNALLESYNDDWSKMLKDELFDYVDNTENVFKGIINCLMSLYGYGSRFVPVNAGSEVGKSEFIKTIKKLMPDFINLGKASPASVRRQGKYKFDKKIVYIGDRGLSGQTEQSKIDFQGLQEVFGELITDKEFTRPLVVGDTVMEFNLKSNGVCVFYTQPYTNLKQYGAGDQYSTRSTYITINPVEDGLSIFLQDENKENKFYDIHKNYIRYILKHPIEVNISNDIKTQLWYASKDRLRTAKYLLALFKAYCQYMQIGNPLTKDAISFLKIFKPKYEVTDIEYEIYRKLYKNLTPIDPNAIEDYYWYDRNGNIEIDKNSMLVQIKDRKEKSFFTAKQIKTYFKSDFRMNKNLKDTLDNIPEILNNLYNADYISRVEWQYNNQNVYYIPYKADLED